MYTTLSYRINKIFDLRRIEVKIYFFFILININYIFFCSDKIEKKQNFDFSLINLIIKLSNPYTPLRSLGSI